MNYRGNFYKKKSNFYLKKYELSIIDNTGMGKAFSFRRESTRNFSYCLAIYDKKKKKLVRLI